VIDNYEPGMRVSASRFANCFKEDRAHFDQVELISIIDASRRGRDQHRSRS
jgi:peptide/nickel transport system substrate-binding protein